MGTQGVSPSDADRELRVVLARVLEEVLIDGEKRAAFVKDPKAVLREHGAKVPVSLKFTVFEVGENRALVTLPPPNAPVSTYPDSARGSIALRTEV